MKNKEQLAKEYIGSDEQYSEVEYNSYVDFLAGFNAGQPKWKFPVNELPEEDTEVLCAVINGWAEELTKHAVLRYFDGNWYGDISENEVVEKWMEIPR